MSKILIIQFLIGSKKEEFQLDVHSVSHVESGGIPWEDKFNLVLNDKFFKFWNYVKDEYGVVISFETLKQTIAATISQKTNGADNKGYPWTHKLEVIDDNQTESIIFHPYTCGLLEEVIKENES